MQIYLCYSYTLAHVANSTNSLPVHYMTYMTAFCTFYVFFLHGSP